MKNTLCLSAVIVAAVVLMVNDGRATPVVASPASTLYADEKSERDSLDVNEVGPDENWQLFDRLAKTKTFADPSDPEKTRVLLKEIEQFSRLVPTTVRAAADDDSDGGTTTDRPDDATETDSASSDWLGSTWKKLTQNDDAAAAASRSDRVQDDDSNVEDIIKKISTDLKKLYTKIKEVITVVKKWIKSNRGYAMNEYDGPSTMSMSASESDGVFVIAEPLIGDVDKSNKYTVPIFSD